MKGGGAGGSPGGNGGSDGGGGVDGEETTARCMSHGGRAPAGGIVVRRSAHPELVAAAYPGALVHVVERVAVRPVGS